MSEKSGMDRAVDTAVMAKKLAAIAKAAAVAGIKGAAVQAAKEFSPQLVKIVVVAIIIIILIPFLIFAALPNIFFGYSTNGATDVLAMTDKAKIIEQAYKSVEDYNEQEVKRIIQELSEGFDEVEVNNDGDNLNHYWYIAICSVAYNQDLFNMNEQDIKNKQIAGFNLFDFSSSSEEFVLADAGQVKTLKKLKVNIKKLDSEELMNKLNFSDEQKNWARVLYRTMADDQTIEPGDPNYVDGTLTNYGDIKFTEGQTEVIYYNQGDARWGSELYGKYDTIKDAACGHLPLP